MATQFVVGLFPSRGIALDAYHRLRTEGFPPGQLAHDVLKEVGPLPPDVQIELEMLALDPLVLGDALSATHDRNHGAAGSEKPAITGQRRHLPRRSRLTDPGPATKTYRNPPMMAKFFMNWICCAVRAAPSSCQN
jgi:hypothetical protein